MDTINNIVKTFISLRVVKSFFYIVLVIYLVNYIIIHFVLWYFDSLWLFYISWVIFLVALFVIKILLEYLKLYNLYFLTLLWFLLTIKTFFFDIKQIKGRSMEPALKEGAWVLVDKIHYGIQLPSYLFPIGYIKKYKYCIELICKFNDLKRYDIVVFDFPDPVLKKRIWIKRIIAFEEEKFEFKEKSLYINQNKIDFYSSIDFLPEYHPSPIFQLPEELNVYPETLQYFFLYGIGKYGVVPKNTFLVLGDNTYESRDSRIYGFIPKDRIIGKVIYAF